MFSKKIDLRSRKQMIEYLTNHFRYDTMNSWNQSTSYANNMKIYKVIPRDLQDKVYNLMNAEGFYDEINDRIADFDREHDYSFQAGFNGRSSGYLVLYIGSVEIRTIFKFEGSYSERDYADNYGWMDKKEAIKRGLYRKEIKIIGSFPGRSLDQHEDFEDFEMYQLQNRVRLVQSFDKLCDDIVNITIQQAKDYTAVEKTISVPKQIIVMEAV